MIRVRSWPALPTNGSPCASSSAPGASPTNISGECMSPTPNTTFFREAARRGHFWHTLARDRNWAIAASFATGSRVPLAAEAGAANSNTAWLGGLAACEASPDRGNKTPDTDTDRVCRGSGAASAANVSGDTGTNLTPHAFRLSKYAKNVGG